MNSKLLGLSVLTVLSVCGLSGNAVAAPSEATLGVRYTQEGRLTMTGTLDQAAGRRGCRARIVGGVSNVGDTSFDKRATLGFRAIARGKKSFKFTLRDLPPVAKDGSDNAPILTSQLYVVCKGVSEPIVSNAKAVFVDCGKPHATGTGANGEVTASRFVKFLQSKIGSR